MQSIVLILLFVGIMFLMHRGGLGCCGGHTGHIGHNTGNNKAESNKNDNLDLVKDPVCGMYINKKEAIAKIIGGKVYYFCSQECSDKFYGEY